MLFDEGHHDEHQHRECQEVSEAHPPHHAESHLIFFLIIRNTAPQRGLGLGRAETLCLFTRLAPSCAFPQLEGQAPGSLRRCRTSAVWHPHR